MCAYGHIVCLHTSIHKEIETFPSRKTRRKYAKMFVIVIFSVGIIGELYFLYMFVICSKKNNDHFSLFSIFKNT